MNIAWTQAAEGLPRRAFSVEEIRRMIDAGVIHEDERIELIEGELVMMAAKGYAHDLVRNALTVAIAKALPDDVMMGAEMTLQFSDNTILEPDIAVYKRAALIRSDANFAQLGPGDLELAIEVAASSLAYDKGVKAQLYAGYRAKEFWVIDANERVTWVHIGPSAQGWSSIVEHGPSEPLTTPAVPGFSIRLQDIE
jgi:Uma2 family endonuclease